MTFQRHRIEKLTTFGAAAMEAATLSMFFYMTAGDTLAQVKANGYFNDMRGKGLQVGDVIEVVASNGRGHFQVTDLDDADDGTGDVVTKRIGMVAGQHVTVDENDTVVTGLAKVAAVVVSLDDDPVAGCQVATASIGDQAGAPASGSFLLKTWKATAAGDTALVAATTFGKKVNWIAFGI